jgi:hypothetical protein
MIDRSDIGISTRARLAHALTELLEADRRVRRCRRLDFSEDGGVLAVIELRAGRDAVPGTVIARELEFVAATALPNLSWIRVQVA